MLTQVRLRQLLHYDPETGIWTWLINRPGRSAKAGDHPAHRVRDGRLQFSVDGKNYYSSRLAWLYMTGHWPEHEVDHEDRNTSNDRWCNLRPATDQQNMANRGIFRNHAVGAKGVSRRTDMGSKPFRARIMVNGTAVHLGYFETADEANSAYASAAKKHFGEFASATG